jgi:hypothetical protein
MNKEGVIMANHSEVIGKRTYDAAVKQFGDGWKLLRPEMREMAVSSHVVNILFAQHVAAKESMEHVLAVARAAFSYLKIDR